SATQALFLKRALVLSSPAIVFVLWSVLGFGMGLIWTWLSLRRELADQFTALKSSFVTFLRLAIATGAMQLATVLTFRDLQVGYSLALFQLSTIVTVLLGWRYFAE